MSDRVTARYRDLEEERVDQRGGDYSIARVDKRAWPCTGRQVGVEAKREVEKGCDALTDRAISLSGMLTLARARDREDPRANEATSTRARSLNELVYSSRYVFRVRGKREERVRDINLDVR